MNSSCSALPTCICSSSSPHSPCSSLESSKNKRLHSPGYIEVKWEEEEENKKGGVDLILMLVSLDFLIFECIFFCILIWFLVHEGFQTPHCHQRDSFFCLYFLLRGIPLFLHSSPIILSLELLWDVAENVTTKETKKMTRGGKKVSWGLSLTGDRRGEKKGKEKRRR